MREYVRYTVNLSVALAMKLLAIMLDIFLLSIFIAHMRRLLERKIPARHWKRSKVGFGVPQYSTDVACCSKAFRPQLGGFDSVMHEEE